MASRQVDRGETRVEETPEIKVHLTTWIVIVCINMLYFVQLVAVVGSGLLTQSEEKLFGGGNQGTWFAQVLNIMSASLAPPVTQMVDYWGRKWTLVLLGCLGFVGALMNSRANSTGMLIAGFAILGINFASQPILMAVASEILPRKHRPWAQAVINTTAGLGGIVSIIMGGCLLRSGQLQNYRIYWYIDAAIYAAATIGCAFCYNPPLRDLQISMTQKQKLQALDWIGFFLFAPGLALLCVALSWSRNPYSWTSAHILAPFIVGLVMLICFGLYEWRVRKDGMFHHGLFGSKNFPLALAAITSEGISFFGFNNYLAFEVSLFENADLLIAGLHFGVLFMVSTPVAMIAGWYSVRMRSVRSPIVAGFVLLTVSYILLAVITTTTPAGVFWAYPALAGLAIGTCLPSIMVTAQLSTPPELIARTTGLIISGRSFGATIGLAMDNAIFTGTLSSAIPKRIAAATLPLGLPATSLGLLIQALTSNNQAALAKVPGINKEITLAAAEALKGAYAVAFRYVWVAAAVFSVVTAISSLFIHVPRTTFNAHIDAPVEVKLIEIQKQVEASHIENVHEE